MITAGSLLGGLGTTVALVVILAGARESVITGAILLGFAFGWALLARLSARFGDRPQGWAAVPGAVMGLAAVGLLAFEPGTGTLTALGWVWPPVLLALVAWMMVQLRREPSSRAGRWFLYPVLAVLALVGVGGSYETVRNATDGTLASTAGHRLVDVGAHRLDMWCTGSGSPTVVLEPGLGESSRAMARWIAPAVGRTTRVCAYDRAGHGRSNAAPGNHADAARDLHVLLERGRIAGPYVLAGHSLGGMFALSYAQRYPADVAGVVLLDSMHPRQRNAFGGIMVPVVSVVPTIARTGLARLLADPKDGAPMAQARQFARDVEDLPHAQDRASKLKTLGDRPLAVITSGKGNASEWAGEQDNLATLSSNSVHRTVAGSTHQSLIDDQQDAARSSAAIRDIVVAVRAARP